MSLDASQIQACDRCHRRKTRCDKSRPECGPCHKAKSTCIYSERVKEPAYARSYVQRLEHRIHQLEAANKALTATNTAYDAAIRAVQEGESHRSQGSSNGGNDVANEVSFLSTNAGGDRLFLGPTSGIIFATLVKAGLAIDMESEGTETPSAALPSRRSPGRADWDSEDRILPPEQLSRSLIETYLAHDHLCYPFLHPRAVRAAVDCIYSDATSDRTHAFELFMFNMILAIATSQVYKFNWRVLPDAEMHHQKAIRHLNAVLCEGGLRALQAMLLLCQFRLSNSTEHASGSLWHIVGIAVRMCFELGLHREAMYRLTGSRGGTTDVSCLSPKFEENEVRRRCFWSVFALDRVVSITLGRPLAICAEDIDIQLPTEDLNDSTSPSALSPGDDQDVSQISPRYRTALFVHIVRYRDICGRCLTSLYRGGRAATQSESDLCQIRDNLATELQAWRADTSRLNPPDMDLSTPLAEARSSFRSKAWYELLYNNGVLLLYRPSTPSVVDASKDGSNLQHVFSAAKQSITIYAYLFRSRKINFSWMVLHAVFMAGLSYIYSLSRHFREKRRHRGNTESPRHQLAHEPTIVEIVNDCRACSNVLVGVSERCNTQKNCHEVFDRLSDALVADAVEALSPLPRPPAATVRNIHTTAPAIPATPDSDVHMQSSFMDPSSTEFGCPNRTYPQASDGSLAELGRGGVHIENDREHIILNTPLAADNALRDCFPELQRMYNTQWGDDAILQLSNDWLDEIGVDNGLLSDDWTLGP